MRLLITFFPLLLLPALVAAQSPAQFVKTYCVKCHSGAKPKAERRFDRLD